MASVLGLLLLIIGVVLFVPIRYKVIGSKNTELYVNANVSWLCRIVYFKCEVKENKPVYSLRIFGYLVLSDKPKKNRNKKVRKKKLQHGRSNTARPVGDKEDKSEKKNGERLKVAKTNVGQAEKTKKETVSVHKDMSEETSYESKEKTKVVSGVKKKGLFGTLRSKIEGIKQKIRDILTLLKGIFRKAGLVKGFLMKKENRPGFAKIIRAVKRLFKYIHPKKLNLKVHFGTGDPCSTGQALGAICLIYPQILNTVQVIPHFEEKILDADLYAKGRIRIFTLLVIAIQLVIDKEFRYVVKEFKNLKEVL